MITWQEAFVPPLATVTANVPRTLNLAVKLPALLRADAGDTPAVGKTLQLVVVPPFPPVAVIVAWTAPASVLVWIAGVHTTWFAGVALLNVAVTDTFCIIESVQVPVPAHPPPVQPANIEPAPGVAVRVMEGWVVYVSSQSVPHVMPALVMVPTLVRMVPPVTVPMPAPAFVT